MISIHAPLAGCDPTALEQALDEAISIHAPLAGCDIASPLTVGGMVISIHAPLAGCDTCWGSIRPRVRYFNPRPPCGVRPTGLIIAQLPLRFQSTHPLRGATISDCRYILDELHFNPRTPCGVRPAPRWKPATAPRYFNPRTPCGVRLRRLPSVTYSRDFNPRTPCGVRRRRLYWQDKRCVISIHAPLAGCDNFVRRFICQQNISIHAPLAGCDLPGWAAR